MGEEMMQDERNIPGGPFQTLDAVLDRCRQKWFRFVLQIVQNHADAEDALQEGFCRVLAAGKDFRSEDQARMYLARTISNAAIEIYHARRKERQSHVPAHDYQLADQWRASPQVFLERREDGRKRKLAMTLMRQALHELPLKQYEALRMTVMDASGSSIRDIGELNGIAYSTLRHRRNMGLRRLRRLICRALRNGNLRLIVA